MLIKGPLQVVQSIKNQIEAVRCLSRCLRLSLWLSLWLILWWWSWNALQT